MIYSLLKALIAGPKKKSDIKKDRKRKLNQKEKDELEYKLWVMAEGYEEEE